MEPDYKKLYEEEHKKYEETLSRAKGLIDGMKEENVNATKEDIKNLFPGEELEENENERVRKNCIHFLELQKKHHAATFEIEECITWLTSLKDLASLEKQDEQKSTDIPKFKVGDWIVSDCNNVVYIESISETMYNLRCKDEYHEKMSVEYVDRCWHLWTIQDAKDGDVLASDNGCPFVYKKSDGTEARLYCCVSIANNFCIDDGIIHCGSKNSAKPATKEQRDLLFTKMKDDGYEWDAEKKELKKIEPKPTWSEEDEKVEYEIKVILANTDLSKFALNYTFSDMLNWLISLKDRVVPQNTWRPTEEQMIVLESAAREAEYNQRFKAADALWSLDKDLKKL